MAAWADFKLANSARTRRGAYPTGSGRVSCHLVRRPLGISILYGEPGRQAATSALRFASNDAVVLPWGNSYVFNPYPGELASWFTYDCETSKCLTTMCASSGGAGFLLGRLGSHAILPLESCVPARSNTQFSAPSKAIASNLGNGNGFFGIVRSLPETGPAYHHVYGWFLFLCLLTFLPGSQLLPLRGLQNHRGLTGGTAKGFSRRTN